MTDSGAPKKRSGQEEREEWEMRPPIPSELSGPEEAGGRAEDLPSRADPRTP